MKKKVLIFIDTFYPGYKAGGIVQSCIHFIHNLYDELEIRIVTSDRDYGDKEAYSNIPLNQWVNYFDKAEVYYAASKTLTLHKIKRIISEISPHYIYLNGLYYLRFSIFPLLLKWIGSIKPIVILAPRGMLHDGALDQKKIKKSIFLACLKLVSVSKNIFFHATDEQEKDDIKKYFPKNKGVFIIPEFTQPVQAEYKKIEKEPGNIKLIYLSRIDNKKNLLYFLEILSTIKESFEIEFFIYGGIFDQGYWQSCQKIISALPDNIKVYYKGAIENSKVISTLQQCHLYVLTTKGENFGYTIFEAFAAGRPVLISDKTPWRNLESVKAGIDLSLNETDSIKDALERFIKMSQAEFDAWAIGAYKKAIGHANHSTLKEKCLQMFSDI